MNTSRPDPTDGMGNWYSRYRDIPNEPLYPFGFGLSYTQFAYSDLQVSSRKLTEGQTITVSVGVKNSGSRPGEEVVQLYIRDPVANRVRPVKELKGFQKIRLAPGAEQRVAFRIDAAMLRYYDEAGKPQLEPGEIQVFVGGNSRDLLNASIEYVLK
jgi:beta-glucosidase